MCWTCFPKIGMPDMSSAVFEMAYVAESYSGDTLSFFREENEDGTYDIEVRKNVGGENPEGEVVCRSKLKFDNK